MQVYSRICRGSRRRLRKKRLMIERQGVEKKRENRVVVSLTPDKSDGSSDLGVGMGWDGG